MQLWLGSVAMMGAALLAAAAVAQTAPSPSPAPQTAPAVPPLTPAQAAAAVLGRWETCIDLTANFLARSALSSERSALKVQGRCLQFQDLVRAPLAESLREMMYGASEEQVTAQTDVAVDSLRRHIHARSIAQVKAVRERQRNALRNDAPRTPTPKAPPSGPPIGN
ncbi:hypothetical protein ACFOMD_02570 [Sphingoaurantiacus capsulatus]|uniref:Uncharacterized protein n=1 Tax=Sphingoaurantiacus capsulatus TaxID=1771310 RepID=A0ABV7X857_9SPHN